MSSSIQATNNRYYMSPIVYGRGRWYGNWDHKARGSRLEKLEEMQRSTVRQKDASETEGEGIQNSDQASNAIWDRKVGYNEETRTSDTQRQDQEWTHTRNNKSGEDFQKDQREKIELVRACDEERWRTHTEESVEGGYTREKEERTTENKMERRVLTIFESTGLRAGEETDRAMWRREIISYTGEPTWWEKPEEKKKKKICLLSSRQL